MDCSPPGSSVHGISQQEYWSGLPFPSSEALPNPGVEPKSPALAGGFFTSEPPVSYNLTLTDFWGPELNPFSLLNPGRGRFLFLPSELSAPTTHGVSRVK